MEILPPQELPSRYGVLRRLNVLYSPGINVVADLSTEYGSYMLVDSKESWKMEVDADTSEKSGMSLLYTAKLLQSQFRSCN